MTKNMTIKTENAENTSEKAYLRVGSSPTAGINCKIRVVDRIPEKPVNHAVFLILLKHSRYTVIWCDTPN